jgi:hypothetical protein
MIGMVAYFAYLVGDYMGLSGIVSLFCCAVRGPCPNLPYPNPIRVGRPAPRDTP